MRKYGKFSKSARLTGGVVKQENPLQTDEAPESEKVVEGLRFTTSPTNKDCWTRATYKGVTIDFDYFERNAWIFDIWSCKRGRGEARQALELLKEQYPHIGTDSVVEDSEEAIAFWQKMLDENIIEKARLTSGEWLIRMPVLAPPAI